MLMVARALPEETTRGESRRFTLTGTLRAGEPSWWLTWIWTVRGGNSICDFIHGIQIVAFNFTFLKEKGNREFPGLVERWSLL